jgi:hypothetical protein
MNQIQPEQGASVFHRINSSRQKIAKNQMNHSVLRQIRKLIQIHNKLANSSFSVFWDKRRLSKIYWDKHFGSPNAITGKPLTTSATEQTLIMTSSAIDFVRNL